MEDRHPARSTDRPRFAHRHDAAEIRAAARRQIGHDRLDHQLRESVSERTDASAILFTPLQHMFHAVAVATRYRFDEGPIRDYKLQIPGKNGSYAVMLPKMSDQDSVADLVAARRLRAEVYLPHSTNVLLDFNVVGAADAVRAIACQ
jgi:hypothetical protein